MYKFILGIAFFVLTILNMPIIAEAQMVQVPNLNTADIPIASQSQEALQQAMRQALIQVLIKSSGNRGIATLPEIQNTLSSANQLVQSYSYYNQGNTQGRQQLFVSITFNRKGLYRLLRQAGQAVWTSQRPLTLIWLNVVDSQGNRVISSSSDDQITTALKIYAFQRGLPYLLPEMDLQDQNEVNVDSVQPFDTQNLVASAKRYGVNTVLAGYMKQNANNTWQGQWLLWLNGEPFRWNNQGGTVDAAIRCAMNSTADIMANQFVVEDAQTLQSTVKLAITNVNDLDKYVQVINYLHKLTPISEVSVDDMNGTILLLDVKVVGGVQNLMGVLKNNPHLQVTAMSPPLEPIHAELYYRWVQ